MKQKWSAILFLVTFAALFTHFMTANGWLTDDAFISFRYADNLATGNGFVYNIGEHVEGYSNFLWVLLIALGIKLGFRPEVFTLMLSIASAAGVVLVICFYIPKDGGTNASTSSHLYTAMILSGIGSFWLWTFGGGLETILYSLLNTTTIVYVACSPYLHEDRRKLLMTAALCFLVALTRPEGVLTFFVIVVALRTMKYRKVKLRDMMWFIVPFGFLFGAYLAWKIWYFKDILPNTFYAKVDSSGLQVFRGVKYCLKFFATYPLITVFAIASMRHVKEREDLLHMAAGFVLVYVIFVSAVGGDFMYAFRLLAPMAPLLAILACRGILVSCEKSLVPWILCLTIFFSALQSRFHPDFKWAIGEDKTVERGEIMGKWLSGTCPQGATIAVTAAGALPYFSKLRTIDMFGLTNRKIAHEGSTNRDPQTVGHLKSDPAAVLREKPDIIIFGEGFGRAVPHSKPEIDVFESQKFRDQYKIAVYIIGQDTARIYIRNGLHLRAM